MSHEATSFFVTRFHRIAPCRSSGRAPTSSPQGKRRDVKSQVVSCAVVALEPVWQPQILVGRGFKPRHKTGAERLPFRGAFPASFRFMTFRCWQAAAGHLCVFAPALTRLRAFSEITFSLFFQDPFQFFPHFSSGARSRTRSIDRPADPSAHWPLRSGVRLSPALRLQ